MKKIISTLLSAAVFLGIISVCALPASADVMTENAFESAIANAQKKYPQDSKYYKYYENENVIASQCMGYAYQVANDVWGSRPQMSGWERSTDFGTIYAGDVIRLQTGTHTEPNHSVFITKVENGQYYFTECNWYPEDTVRWDRSYSETEMRKYFAYKDHVKGNTLKGTTQTPIIPDAPKIRYYTADGTANFRWDACKNALKYSVLINSTTGATAVDEKEITDTNFSCVLPVGDYKITVASYSQTGDFSTGKTVSFSVTGADMLKSATAANSITVGDKVYTLYNEKVDWFVAKKWCLAKGGNLAVISSAQEQSAIETLVGNNRREYWLGASSDEYGEWEWVTGEAFNYENWNDGEPNNSGNVEHWLTISDKTNYRWNDMYSSPLGFICEMKISNQGRLLYGDANNDGSVTTADILTLNQYNAGMAVNINLEKANCNYDLTSDGKPLINTTDALVLSQYLASIKVKLGK